MAWDTEKSKTIYSTVQVLGMWSYERLNQPSMMDQKARSVATLMTSTGASFHRGMAVGKKHSSKSLFCMRGRGITGHDL